MNTTYAVTAVYAVTGEEEVSRLFRDLHAARKWAAWLATKAWARNVRIMAGGPGGMEVS